MQPLVLDIHDTGSNSPGLSDTLDAVVSGLSKPKGSRSIPSFMLYDERGLQLYDAATTQAPEYYLFECERQILADHADEIVKAIGVGEHRGEAVIDLGAGSLRKTSYLLLALARSVKVTEPQLKPPMSYFALDLDRAELFRTLKELSASIGSSLDGRILPGGLWGTYDHGIAFIKRGGLQRWMLDHTSEFYEPQISPTTSESDGASSLGICGARSTANSTPPSSLSSPIESGIGTSPVHFLFLGSTIGSFTREEAAQFLRSLPLRPDSGDTLLLGLNGKNDPELIRLAYSDPKGLARDFVLNGLDHTSKILGNAIDRDNWSHARKYTEETGCLEAYYQSNVDQVITLAPSSTQLNGQVIAISAGELVHALYSHKYSDEDAAALFSAANLCVVRHWKDKKGLYSLWLLERALTPTHITPDGTTQPGYA